MNPASPASRVDAVVRLEVENRAGVEAGSQNGRDGLRRDDWRWPRFIINYPMAARLLNPRNQGGGPRFQTAWRQAEWAVLLRMEGAIRATNQPVQNTLIRPCFGS